MAQQVKAEEKAAVEIPENSSATAARAGAFITGIRWWTRTYPAGNPSVPNGFNVAGALQFTFSDGYQSDVYGTTANATNTGNFNNVNGFTGVIYRSGTALDGFAMVTASAHLTEWVGHATPGGNTVIQNFPIHAATCTISTGPKYKDAVYINGLSFGIGDDFAKAKK